MKNFVKNIVLVIVSVNLISCGEDYLDEVPLDRYSPENLLVDESGFNLVLTAVYQAARFEHFVAGSNFDYMNLGTDVARWGRADSRGFADYALLNPSSGEPSLFWDWAYEEVIPRANLVLEGIDNPDLDMTDDARANVKGQALFFRAYVYNALANLFGGVPIIDSRLTVPKFDFERATRQEVLEFVASDLESASNLLYISVEDGKVPRAAAFHLLTEVYISLGVLTEDNSYYDKSINAATKVISQEAGDYHLMTERFGSASSLPGDVYSDIHAYGQINKSEGNSEVILAWQIELYIVGAAYNQQPRWWGPQYDIITTPNGFKNSAVDSLLRGIGVLSPTNYSKYDIWNLDPNDIRNSKYNIRRTFYYNNSNDSEYFGKPIKTAIGSDGNLYVTEDDGTLTSQKLDTVFTYYPWFRKIEGAPRNDSPATGNSGKDITIMRVAETYLLRAEAYFRKGMMAEAASDINVIRSRANASPINGSDVTEDFILDERARELIVEEPRMRTLIRMGRLVDRVRTYNSSPYGTSGLSAGTTIQDYNNFWPIPQRVIDANSGSEMAQNPGY
ncbi:MAG: RagB/SusD family nutrient uptake outer membrane protein [Cyclobacteriaceae bacterium]